MDNVRHCAKQYYISMLMCFSDALVRISKQNLELFLQISQWDCASEYLKEVWRVVHPQDFIETVALKYEGWLKIRYIQSLIDQEWIERWIGSSHDFCAICFVATNASSEQDVVLAKRYFKADCRENKVCEAKLARSAIQTLTNKAKFAPLIAEQLKNKEIVLYSQLFLVLAIKVD